MGTIGAQERSQADQESRSTSPRVDRLLFLLLCLVGLWQVLAYRRSEPFGISSSTYLRLAENLLAGVGYLFNAEPHTLLPPGFPWLLAGLGKLTESTRHETLVRFMPLLAMTGIWCWYRVLRRVESPVVAAVACALLATSTQIFGIVTGQLLAEPAYLLFSGAAIWCFIGAIDESRRIPTRAALAVGSVLLVAFNVSVRTAGLALAVGCGVWAILQLMRRRRTFATALALLMSLAGAMSAGSWVAYTAAVPPSIEAAEYAETYANQLWLQDPRTPDQGVATRLDLVRRAATMAPIQGAHLAQLWSHGPWIDPLWFSPVILVVLLALATGVVTHLADPTRGVLTCYFAVYFGIHCLWAFDEGTRFMLPVAPLAAVVGWWGLTKWWTSAPSLGRTGLRAIGTGLIGLSLVAALTHRRWGQQASASVFALAVTGALPLVPRIRQVVLQRLLSWALAWKAVWLTGIGSALLVLSAYQFATLTRQNLVAGVESLPTRAAVEFADWVATAPRGGIMAEEFQVVHRLTDRRIERFPPTGDAERIMRAMQQGAVRYLMVRDRTEFEYMNPAEVDRLAALELAYPGRLMPVFRGNGFSVFEISGASGLQ